MLTSLNLILAPATAGVRASGGPRKGLSCQAMPRLELVEAGGKALVGTRHRRLDLHPITVGTKAGSFFFFNFIILYSAVLGHDSLNTHSLS